MPPDPNQPNNPLPDPVFVPDRRPRILHTGIDPLALVSCALLALIAGIGMGAVYAETILGTHLPYFPVTDPVAVDGNTVQVSILLHVDGVSVPQLDSTRCPEEAALARKARDRVQTMLNAGPVRIQLTGENVYGQLNARITAADRPIGPVLLREKLAKETIPGSPARWCPNEAQNHPGPVQRMLAWLAD